MSFVVVDRVCFDVLQDMKSATSTNLCLLSPLILRGLKVMVCSCPLDGILIGRLLRCRLMRTKLPKLFLITVGISLLPNGMTMAFIQSNLNTVRDDVMCMFAKFFSFGKLMASINATFIGLIPKEAKVENIRDF